MSKFKVGDRVKIVNYRAPDAHRFQGKIGTVAEVRGTTAFATLDGDTHKPYHLLENELALHVDTPPEPATSASPNRLSEDFAVFLGLALNTASAKFQANAIDKGFQTADRNLGEMIALIMREASEMLEEIRKPEPEQSKKIPAFTAEEDEWADTFIRLVQYGVQRKLRMAEAVVAKHNYNTTRPHKHGKKF